MSDRGGEREVERKRQGNSVQRGGRERENCSLSALLLFLSQWQTNYLSFHFKINHTFKINVPFQKQGKTLACIYCIVLHRIMYTEHIKVMIEELTVEEFKRTCIG